MFLPDSIDAAEKNSGSVGRIEKADYPKMRVMLTRAIFM
jgi:hypothetical protein